MELPGQDRERFCKAIVDYETRAILSLTVHEEEDWQDRERFDRQMMELDQYTQAMGAYQSAAAEHDAMARAHDSVTQEIGDMAMDPQHQADMLAAHAPLPPPPMAPPMPDWMAGDGEEPGPAEPEPVRKIPLHMFSHAVCIEPMVGNLGLSFGRQQADHNRAVDTWVSQFTDASTLGNSWSLITAGSIEFERPFSISPGTVNAAQGVAAGDLDKVIKELRPGQANPQLMDLIGLVKEWSQSSIQSAPILSGEAGKSGETFRGVNSRIDQASKQLSVPTRVFGDFFANIAKNNAKLNAVYLDDEEIFQVNNEQRDAMEELKVGRAMYVRNYQIKLKSDLTFASIDARIAAADECVQIPAAVPQLQGNALYMYKALKKSFELRGRYDLIDALGPPPPPPQVPFGTPVMPPGMPPGAPGEVPQGAPPQQQ